MAAGPATIAFLDHTASLGGGETYLLSLLKHLDRSRYRPLLVLGEEGPLAARARALGVRVEVIPVGRKVLGRGKSEGIGGLLRAVSGLLTASGAVARLVRLLKAERVALVHTNSLKSQVYGGLAARLARRPAVWYLHDNLAADFFPPWLRLGVARSGNLLANRALCNSAATREALLLCGGRSDRALTIHYGIDLEVFNGGGPHAAEARRALGLPPRGPLVGNVARLAPWKGQIYFVQAAPRILAAIPDAHFVIAGEALFGPRDHAYRADIESLIRTLGLGKRIRLLGFQDDVPRVLAALDVMVHASIAPEGVGLSVAEALAMGKPVVSTRV
ncbi:MAG: glycosyltransferase, partial [Candidatus Rokubacteria bacterium]|nr:glycosyltransferase [Candidatus Rokubacteria bacterium]